MPLFLGHFILIQRSSLFLYPSYDLLRLHTNRSQGPVEPGCCPWMADEGLSVIHGVNEIRNLHEQHFLSILHPANIAFSYSPLPIASIIPRARFMAIIRIVCSGVSFAAGIGGSLLCLDSKSIKGVSIFHVVVDPFDIFLLLKPCIKKITTSPIEQDF